MGLQSPVGVILAGGLGRRMGGVSKSMLELGGQSLLARSTERLGPQVATLAVNANTPIKTELPVLTDPIDGHLGPLAGILAGLIWAEDRGARHVITVAVDTPFFPCDLVPQLIQAGEAHPSGLAIAATSDGPHGTFGRWPVSLRASLACFLDSGGRKVTEWTAQHDARLALFPDTQPPSFFNINTPEDLAQARSWI